MTERIPDDVRPWIGAPEFATMATILPDGRPQLSVVWVGLDGDDVVVSTVKGRRKHLNMLADPRVTILVFPRDRPYSYVEIRGTASMSEEGGVELVDRLNQDYYGTPRHTADDGTDHVRIFVRITPDRVFVRR